MEKHRNPVADVALQLPETKTTIWSLQKPDQNELDLKRHAVIRALCLVIMVSSLGLVCLSLMPTSEEDANVFLYGKQFPVSSKWTFSNFLKLDLKNLEEREKSKAGGGGPTNKYDKFMAAEFDYELDREILAGAKRLKTVMDEVMKSIAETEERFKRTQEYLNRAKENLQKCKEALEEFTKGSTKKKNSPKGGHDESKEILN